VARIRRCRSEEAVKAAKLMRSIPPPLDEAQTQVLDR
jgi:hypothetical protein